MNGKNLAKPFSTTLKRLTTTPPVAPRWEPLLFHCANTKNLATTKKLHTCILTSGTLVSSSNPTHLMSLLVSAYSHCGDFTYACHLFDKMPHRTSRVYRAMIRMHVEKGSPNNALKLFMDMLEFGNHTPDKYIFPFVIRACGMLSLRDLGVCVHGLAMVSGFGFDRFVGNSLLAMYMRCGDKEWARRVFNAMREKSTVAWNTMISGSFRNGSAKEALMVFREMVDGGVEMDCATILSVLPVCGYLQDLKVGIEVHSIVEEKGLGSKLAVWNSLVDMYVKCGQTNEAQKIFDEMDKKDVVAWTTMINGYLLKGDVSDAINLSRLMQLEGVRPNEVTLASLLAACANLPYLMLGKCMHGWALRQELDSDVNVETALVDMYAKCRRVQLALRVFSRTSKKKTVPWNAIVSGCVHNELGREAIILFKEMLFAGVKPNDATLKSLLPAYAIEPDLQQVMSIHSFLIRSGFISKTEITTGILDVYAKCGGLDYAHRIFNQIPVKDKDIILWSVIIAGYGMHGNGEVAVSLFREMVQTGVDPNEITFTSVLHACSHSGSVDDGLSLFDVMQKRHPSCLRIDHYTCMVDLLGRAGRLEEAHELIRTMPFEPSHAVWGALLGSCVIHENVELGEVAAKWLFELEPGNTGNFVLMGKIYAALGRWRDVENIRHRIKKIGLIKTPAHSAIEVRN
ncbi:hypothetical protein LIER_08431 [Lithospermum erythrorhizon]|uniref:Pentatricopeptide repeat-containing protein n=1 Tax=Lithospermum erythrorhizon TaxID=34254 RepID=A0AAV3PCR0_LITER